MKSYLSRLSWTSLFGLLGLLVTANNGPLSGPSAPSSNLPPPVFIDPVPNDTIIDCVRDFEQDVILRARTDEGDTINVMPQDMPAFDQADFCNGDTIVRTWTATDNMGQMASVSQQVIIQADNEGPTIDLSPTTDTVSCFVAQGVQPSSKRYDIWLNSKRLAVATNARDCSSLVEITDDAPAAYDFDCDDIEVTFSLVDTCGNLTTIAFRYVTIDTFPPVLNGVPADTTIACDAAVPPPATVEAEDCSRDLDVQFVETSTQTQDGTCSQYAYEIVRTWSATDSCGNMSQESQVITVQDEEPPVFTVPADVSIRCDQDTSDVNLVGTVTDASDNCSSTVSVGYTDEILYSADCPDTYTIFRTWRASDVCGNVRGEIQTIYVNDHVPPIFQVPADITVTCEDADELFITGEPSNLEDFCDPNPTITYTDVIMPSGQCDNNYSIRRTWRATDRCGNVQNQDQIITVVDQTPPTFTTLPSNLTITCGSGTDFEQAFNNWVNNRAGAFGTDNCTFDADLTYYVYESGTTNAPVLPPVDCGPEDGAIRRADIDVIIEDECGNTSSSTVTFRLIDNTPPELTECSPGMTVATDPGQCTAQVTLPVPVITDDCATGSSVANYQDSAPITSNAGPGQQGEVPANPIDLQMQVNTPLPVNAQTAGQLTISLTGADAEAAEEFFRVYGEDGTLLGRTAFTQMQCGNSDTTFTLTVNQINAWGADGSIDIRLEPNIPTDKPGRFAVNALCMPAGSASAALTFQRKEIGQVAYGLRIDGGAFIEVDPIMDYTTVLDQGTHLITHIARDCAGNVDSCSYAVTVEDREAPELICPSDVTLSVAADSCQASLELPLPKGAADNCGVYDRYDRRMPQDTGFAYLQFDLDPNLGEYQMRQRNFVFNDVKANAFNSVDITVDFLADLNTNEAFITFLGDDSSVLGTTPPGASDCNTPGQMTFTISASTFNDWAADGQITIRAVPNDIMVPPGVPGDGVNPCNNNQVDFSGDRDSTSFMFVTLQYDRLQYEYFGTGATQIPQTAITQPDFSPVVTLNVGQTEISYVVPDLSGNIDTCSFTVSVEDNIQPTARCQPTNLFINPSGTQIEIVDAGEVDNGSFDNCGIDTMYLTPNTFDCTDAGTTRNVTLTVVDASGNTSTCSTIVGIMSEGPQPTANSGLCGGDTLYLFANPPSSGGANVYTYEWYGPANTLVSTKRDPVLPDIDSDDEGPYRVVIRGLTGCTAEGVVNVTIQDLPLTPSVVTSASACLSEPILLTSSVIPSGNNVRFRWYEGVSPNGNLLAVTTEPEYVIPGPHPVGQRRFYLEVEANGCVSAPSATVNVQTVQRPVAQTTYRDTLVCTGSSVTLGAVGVSGVSYQWSGPNGFTSNQQFPVLTNVQATAEGYYYLRLNRGGCISEPDSVLVSTKPLPARPQISNSGPVCAGNAIVLSSTATGASAYHWISPSGQETITTTPSLTIPMASTQAAGQWRMYVTRNGCDSERSEPTTVVINNNPVASASFSPMPLCEGSDLVLSGFSTVAGSSYQWTGPNNFSSNVSSPVRTNVTAAAAGTYRLVVTSPAGCRDTTEVNVQVRSRARVLGISSSAPSCIMGQSDVTLTPSVFPADNGSYTYKWNGPAGSGTGPTYKIPNATPSASGSYTLEVFNENGCSSGIFTYVLDLTFAPPQPALPSTVSGQTQFCVGDQFVLTTTQYAGDSVLYLWTLPNGSVVQTFENMFMISGAGPANSGSYRVQVVRDGCASPMSNPRMIEVNKIPLITATSNSPVCAGDVIQLSATDLVDATYEWRGPGSFSSGLRNPIIPNADPTLHNGSYRVFATRKGCRSDTVSVQVSIKDRPEAPSVSAGPAVCMDSPDAVLLLNIDTVSAIPGATYQWFTSNGNVALGNPTPALVFELTNFSAFPAGGSYNVFARTIVDGCASPMSAPVIVELNRIPAEAAFAGRDTSVCAGQYILRGRAPGVGTGQWTVLSGGSDALVENPSSPNSVISGLSVEGGPYVLQWALSRGACREYSLDTVVLTITPGEAALAGDDILACEDEMVTLGATPVTGMNSVGTWSQPLAQEILGVKISDKNDPSTLITGLEPDNVYSFTWTVQSVCGTQSDVILVNISDPSPDAGTDETVCDPSAETVLMAADPTIGSSGRWSAIGQETTIDDPDNPVTTVGNLQPGTNQFVWTIDEGICGDASRDTVTVFYKEPPVAVDDLVAVPFDRPVQVAPLVNDQLPPGSVLQVSGQPDRGTITLGSGSTLTYTPPANFVGDDQLVYEIVSEGCTTVTGLITFRIGGDASCIPPNIFTPNNDGVNDNFVVPCLLNLDRFPDSRVVIYNRWGDEVYRSTVPYRNDWSGTYNGEPLPADTYFYVIDFGHDTEPVSGHVMIQR